MEINELKSAWNDLNLRVTAIELKQRKSKLYRAPIAEFVVGLFTVLGVGAFLGQNFPTLASEPVWAIPGVLVFLLGIHSVAGAIYQWAKVSELTADLSILESQKLLADLRIKEVKGARFWLWVLVPLWFVFPVLLVQMLGGPQNLENISAPWMVANVVFGVGLILVAAILVRQFPALQKLNGTLKNLLTSQAIRDAEAELAQTQSWASEQ